MQDPTYRHHTVTAPNGTLPVSLDEARRQLRTEGMTFDDDLVELLIRAAASNIEVQYGLGLLEQTVKQYHAGFPASANDPMFIWVAPLMSVTGITYTDTTGTTQTFDSDDYTSGGFNGWPFIIPKVGKSWPTAASGMPNAVTIEYKAGFGAAASSIPKEIKQAILLMVGDMYENRQDRPDNLPRASKSLLKPYSRFPG